MSIADEKLNSIKKKSKIILHYFGLITVSIILIFPIFWMITIALKSDSSVVAIPPEWFPDSYHWDNFLKGMDTIGFVQKLINTVIITFFSTAGQVISSVLIGFAFARIKFPGKKIWFTLVIMSMMMPPIVGLIPLFKVYKNFGWFNTWMPLIFPNLFGDPFYIFLARQFFSTIPIQYDESAKMDGAGIFTTFYKIILPLLKPMIVVIIIWQVQKSWNDYLMPLVYLIKDDIWTLSLALAQFLTEWRISWNLFMAVNILFILPMLIVYFIAQRYFMYALGSLNTSGIK